MKKIAFVLAFLLCLLPLGGCRGQSSFTETYFYMDTVIGVTLYTEEKELAETAFDRCRSILSRLDALWARQKSDSEIAKWNRGEGRDKPLDPATAELLLTAIDISQRTGGAFDITVAPVADLWQTCGKRGSLPTEEELSQALSLVGYTHLQAIEAYVITSDLPELTIDLGGIGKGAAIDSLLAYLKTLRVEGGLVTFGSNVAVFGTKSDNAPFRIALRDPFDQNAAVGTLLLSRGQILSVSGDYERYVTIDGKNYHHILDPETGYPSESGLTSVAVVAADGVWADALSTALFVMGKDEALAFYESSDYPFEAVLIEQNGSVTVTEGLQKIWIANSEN